MKLNASWFVKLTILIFDVMVITNSDSRFHIEQCCDTLGWISLWSITTLNFLSAFY